MPTKGRARCSPRSLSPQCRICQVPIGQILAFLRKQFGQWTLPQAIRTDNGEPFGVPTRDVIPLMSLWLAAWGIAPILNRPRRPTDNAVVERGQGTSSRWAEPDKCQSIAEFQQKLDEACRAQRENYKAVRLGNVSRGQLHKSLWENPRPFDAASFDEKAAHAHLAKAILPRKVSPNGTIALYGKIFSVGAAHKGKIMVVKFDPKTVTWTVLEQTGLFCKTIPDERFYKNNLINLKCQ